jgi:hypothetical protein
MLLVVVGGVLLRRQSNRHRRAGVRRAPVRHGPLAMYRHGGRVVEGRHIDDRQSGGA